MIFKRDSSKGAKSVLGILLSLLLTSGYFISQAQTFSGNATPCVNDQVTYSAQPCDLNFPSIAVIVGQENVDYKIVSSSLSSKTIQWLKTGDYTIRVSYGSCTTGTVYTVNITVSPALRPLPVVSQQVDYYESENIILKVDNYTNEVGWYDGNNVLLETSFQLRLGSTKPVGSYTYTARVVNEQGCQINGNASTTFQVTVKNYEDSYFNRIETKVYDGGSTVVSHTKSFIDQTGTVAQLQTKNLSRNEVFTSESFDDEQGRPVISTLSAPIGGTDLHYKNRFARTSDGELLSEGGLAIPDVAAAGTLGWYYSVNNNKESHTPVTSFPYSENVYYDDGTEEIAAVYAPGESHRRGSGHGVISGTFPVYGELDDYVTKRATFFTGLIQNFNKAGCSQRVVRDQNGIYAISILDGAGNEIMTAKAGTEQDHVLAVQQDVAAAAPLKYRLYLPLIHNVPDITVTASGGYITDNLLTVERDFFVHHSSTLYLGPGLFRIWPYNSTSLHINYTLYLKDISYKFYDDRGKLIAMVSPNGVKQWLSGVPYANIDKTTYTYNFKGFLIASSETDAGTSRFLYRKDGQIRFSQNAQQKQNEVDNDEIGQNNKGKFSYTRYDILGRPIESGEYIGQQKFELNNTKLEFGVQQSYQDTDKKDWVITYYDDPDAALSSAGLPAGFKQQFVRGTVSYSENKHVKTWYSYDELGRVTWMAQKPKALQRTFVVKYTYDFLGNVLTAANLAFESGEMVQQFYHHYEYDADKRLSKAYTSQEENGSRRLRATYEYYLHGPLKRIELGDDMQGVDFVYNIHGWLTQINHPDPGQDPGGDGNDVFGMVLDYYESQLDNVFSANVAPMNSNMLHVLPELYESRIASHQPLIRFDSFQAEQQPANTFRKYSAEQPIYKTMVQDLSTTTD